LSLADEEIPKANSVDYIISPPVVETVDALTDDGIVVYCIDISGSMCVTTEVPGLQSEWKKLRLGATAPQKETAPADQYLPGQKRDVTYISRLECIQVSRYVQLYGCAIPNKECL